jgi:hypothetical protein
MISGTELRCGFKVRSVASERASRVMARGVACASYGAVLARVQDVRFGSVDCRREGDGTTEQERDERGNGTPARGGHGVRAGVSRGWVSVSRKGVVRVYPCCATPPAIGTCVPCLTPCCICVCAL